MLPDSWTEARLGDVAEVTSGGTPRTDEPSFWGGEIVWVTPGEVVANQGSEIASSKRMITRLGLASSGARLVQKGTVLVTSRATIGAVAIAGCELAVNQGFAVLTAGPTVDPRFLYYWAVSMRPEMERLATGSTFPEISRSKVRNLTIILPSIEEQRQIVRVLDQTIESARRASSAHRERINSLRNLETSLLENLVSGRVRLPMPDATASEVTA